MHNRCVAYFTQCEIEVIILGFNLSELHRVIFIGVLLAYTLFAYFQLTQNIQYGRPLIAAIWVWLASPMPLYIAALGIERRDPFSVGLWHQSWSFLLGDCLVLPVMAALLAKSWSYLLDSHAARVWCRSRGWYLFCLFIGWLAGLAFHLSERANYVPLAWDSPSKLVHDFCAYVVLGGGLLFGLVPALLVGGKKGRWYTFGAVACLLLWVALVVLDNTVHHLDGRDLHVMFDWYSFRPVDCVSF